MADQAVTLPFFHVPAALMDLIHKALQDFSIGRDKELGKVPADVVLVLGIGFEPCVERNLVLTVYLNLVKLGECDTLVREAIRVIISMEKTSIRIQNNKANHTITHQKRQQH